MSNANRPNLVYILSDQHRYDIMGAAGDDVAETPNLDRLAGQGAVFEQMYCQSPLCAPSRMSLLTGRQPHENGVWYNDHILHSGYPTIAHALGAAGYQPHLIGKMHARGPDQLLGFVSREVGDHGPGHLGGRPPDKGPLGPTSGPFRMSLDATGIGKTAYQRRDEEAAAAAIRYLSRGADRNEPFALMVGLMLPHQPYIAEREDFDRFDGRVGLPRIRKNTNNETHPFYKRFRQQGGIEDVDDKAIVRARTAYYALVYRMDRLVGSILDALASNNLEDDTIVVYTSDHGDMLGERDLWWKQVLLDGAVKVPCILSWPGHIAAGKRVPQTAGLVDITATLLDAMDLPELPGATGRTLLPVLTGEGQVAHDSSFAENCFPDGTVQRMIRRGPWKLIYHLDLPAELYNLESDPDEVHNLGTSPEHTEILHQLLDELLDGWDPNVVRERILQTTREVELLTKWGQETGVVDEYRWVITPDMFEVDSPGDT